jgi:hypothetical protein
VFSAQKERNTDLKGSHCMHADLRQLSQQVTKERELYKIKVTEAFVPIRDLFIKYCEVSLSPTRCS